MHSGIKVDGKLLWIDQGRVQANDAIRQSASGMSDFPVQAVLWCFGPKLDAQQEENLAQLLSWEKELRSGLSAIPHDAQQTLYLIRGLGMHMEEVRRAMTEAWAYLRENVLNTPAHHHRLWST